MLHASPMALIRLAQTRIAERFSHWHLLDRASGGCKISSGDTRNMVLGRIYRGYRTDRLNMRSLM